MPEDAAPYAIGDLATLGGVSRRTVRYYVQEGLIPPPAGLGRGNHYGEGHLEALLRVKAMQEQGQTLDEIRRTLYHRGRRRAPVGAPISAPGGAAADAPATPPTNAATSGAANAPLGGPASAPAATAGTLPPALGRSLWRRLIIAAGVELHVDSTVDLPSPAALRELDDWCRRHLTTPPRHPNEKDRDEPC